MAVFLLNPDCRPIRVGNRWILDFPSKADAECVVVDGANGQQLLVDSIKRQKLMRNRYMKGLYVYSHGGIWMQLENIFGCYAWKQVTA